MAYMFQDLRNHGHSFHSKEHNYEIMAEDVEKFIQQQNLDKCVLIGHSMYACNIKHVCKVQMQMMLI